MNTARRLFSSSSSSRSLFRTYLDSHIRPAVKEVTAAQVYKTITTDRIHGKPATYHIIDVREPVEWNSERLPYAKYTGRGTLERDIESHIPDSFDSVVLYCASGIRSQLAASALQDMGYSNVFSLKGGIKAWKQSGYETIAGNDTFQDANQ